MRVVDMFRFQARERQNREFAVEGDRSLNYAEADALILRLVSSLRQSGLGPEDRVAIIEGNSIEFVLIYLACALVGCVPVPLNIRLVPSELAYILNDFNAQLIIVGEEFVSTILEVAKDVPSIGTFIVIGDVAPNGWLTYADWTAVEKADERSLESLPNDIPALQIYTSGTTGRPKGVLMSNRAMGWYAMGQGAPLAAEGVIEGRLLVAAPIFHAGITALWFTSIAWGGSLFIQDRFVARQVVDALRNERISWTLLIPSMIRSCLTDVEDVAMSPYPDLKLMVYGGSSIAEKTLLDAMEVFGCEFLQQYGLTETNAIVNLSTADHRAALKSRPSRLLSTGRTLAGCKLRIVDSEGKDVDTNEVGEIVVWGPQLMDGYWNNEAATTDSLRDGWFWTGDVGFLDEDDYLYVRDRKKDMIVTGGENVYSQEVESVLFDHPEVVDAAVIGVPDERWGEIVVALVVLVPDTTVEPEEIITFCRSKLAGFKCPKSIGFVKELPRNASGKLLKRQLREEFSEHMKNGLPASK